MKAALETTHQTEITTLIKFSLRRENLFDSTKEELILGLVYCVPQGGLYGQTV